MKFFGPVPQIRQTTIVEIAARENPASLAESIQIAIARSATASPEWLEAYERLLEAMGDDRLVHVEVCLTDVDLEDCPSYEAIAYVGQSLDDALGVFDRPEDMLKLASVAPDTVDLVAATVGAEIWMTALGVSCFGSSVMCGPDSISAAAAVIARYAGEPVPSMPLDPEWPSMVRPLTAVAAAERHCRAWVVGHFGLEMWQEVAPRVVNDLSWGAGSASKTHEAALLVGARLQYDFA